MIIKFRNYSSSFTIFPISIRATATTNINCLERFHPKNYIVAKCLNYFPNH